MTRIVAYAECLLVFLHVHGKPHPSSHLLPQTPELFNNTRGESLECIRLMSHPDESECVYCGNLRLAYDNEEAMRLGCTKPFVIVTDTMLELVRAEENGEIGPLRVVMETPIRGWSWLAKSGEPPQERGWLQLRKEPC